MPNEDSHFLEDNFGDRANVRASIQFRREKQSQHLKRWFFLPIFKSMAPELLDWSNETNCVIPALKPTALVYNVKEVGFKFKSSQIICLIITYVPLCALCQLATILQITSSGISLMYSRKSVWLRKEPWGIPTLTGILKKLPIQNHHLSPRKRDIRPNTWPGIS